MKDLKDSMTIEKTGPPSSLRSKAFLLFAMNMRPTEVSQILCMKKNTSYRYFQQWKHRPGDCVFKYKAARILWAGLSCKEIKAIANVLADELCTSIEAVFERMETPWALKQMINGKWRDWDLPIQERSQPSRLSRLTERITSRKSKDVALLLDLIFCQERFLYSDDEDDEEVDL